MAIEVRVPESMRQYAGDKHRVSVAGPTISAALQQLRQQRPALYNCVCDETGAVRQHIHVFVNSDFIPVHEPSGMDVVLRPGDVLTIWTAVSGG